MAQNAGYVEFAATSNFSFLRGASHPEEFVAAALQLGLAGLGLSDRNSVAGVVRGHVALRELRRDAPEIEFRYHPGARLAFRDGTPDILAYPRDRDGWGRLCRLLTLGNRRAGKGDCLIDETDLLAHAQQVSLIVMPGAAGEPPAADLVARLREAASGRVRIAACCAFLGDDARRLARAAAAAEACGVRAIAVNDALYHVPMRRPLQDAMTAIRLKTTVEGAGRRLEANAERHLKSADQMARLFREHPQLLSETIRLSDELAFSLEQLRYEYPDEIWDGFSTAQAALVHFTYLGAEKRYPGGIPDKVRLTIAHELALIGELAYAPYFLTVFDIVRFARGQGILCQGRGSAANSAVCFCLGITEVDPARSDLLFERFVSADRGEPPDIDVDFEHERREEVIQYIYRRYGRERAGLAATVISYRARSALRETGKVMGLSADALEALASGVWGYGAERLQKVDAAAAGIDRDAPGVRRAFALAEQIAGFPRHLSQHVGGFVVTRGRLDELVPIQNAAMEDRTVIEWDKDDIDALGILKIDVLGLGMLTCLRNALDLLRRQYGRELTLATIPAEDPAVYRMLSRADSLGVFQVESRAQMSMLPRLKPRTFYDLVIEVAIVRPGPIQGDMVHPYLRRRQGLEPVSFPSAALEEVLGKTLGVPLFQEQAMKIAIVAAGFTPSEADRLRRAMATFRKVGTIGTFQAKMIEGMVANGYDRAFAERCFRQIEGFGEYGFPESHAASFALLVYASSWFKCHYPDVFAAALLNSQPLGFYAPAQIVRDAREHGVAAREVDVNHSAWDATLEPCDLGELQPRHAEMAGEILSNCAIRLGFREIKGLPAAVAASITQHRGGGYDSVRDLWLRTGLQASTLEQLADADAFGSLGLTRRDALWAVRALGRTGDDDDLPLFAAVVPGQRREPDADLPPMPLGEEVANDYRSLRLSLKAHPVSFMRHRLDWRRVTPCMRLGEVANGARVAVAGLVLVRQRPGTAKGVIFATLEDEGGVANVIVWPKVFERYRKVVLGARVLLVTGTLQSEHGVIHVVARHLEDATGMLAELTADLTGVDPVMPADEVKRPEPGSKRGRAASEKSRTDPASSAARDAMPKGRNFH